MKAAKPVVLVGLLAMAALVAILFVLLSDRNTLLITDATAAQLLGKPATVGVFLTIENSGGPDRLTAARSIVAQRARLESAVADAGLPIPAESSASLAPDGAFILLDGVGGDLKEGRMIPITLRFETAGELRTQARLVAPRTSGVAAAYGLFGIGDICTVEDGEPAPRLSIEVNPDGTEWIVTVKAEDFTFSQDMLNGPHVPGTGHGHLYLGGLKVERFFEPEVRIGALPPGTHEVRVTLNTNDHRAYVVDDEPVTATARITVP